MMTEAALLPPNATPLLSALATVSARVGDIEMPLAQLWDPQACPMPILPWLAWALSVDTWDADWTDDIKREAVALSIAEHRRKGTRFAVETVLGRFDQLAAIVEWHETMPRGAPHTFEVILPMVTAPGAAPGGTRASAAFAEQVIREISRTKPLREHFQFVQQVTVAGLIGVQSVARVAVSFRQTMLLGTDESQPWANFLQCETGEPLQAETGAYLEDVA
jgi:phage tail P2-like protein